MCWHGQIHGKLILLGKISILKDLILDIVGSVILKIHNSWILFCLASMPTFMQNADRIVGGEAAPSMIPWQVAMLSGTFQFCGGLYLYSYWKMYDILISSEAFLKYYSF